MPGSALLQTRVDLRHALRTVKSSPGFFVTVTITLALTVGLATTVFSVFDAVFIRPMPYHQPERIFALNPLTRQGSAEPASYPEYREWRRENQVFSALAGYMTVGTVNLESLSGPVALHWVQTTDNFFDVFGVKPLMGRTFTDGEDQFGRNAVAVLSFEVWKHYFSGQPSAIGQQVKLDGRPYRIVGVMPPGFRFPLNMSDAVYLPLTAPQRQREGWGNHWLPSVARLKPGVSAQEAEASMNRLLDMIGQAHPTSSGRRLWLIDIVTFTVGDAVPALRLLFYAVVALLATGCVNLAGLFMVRGVKIEYEMAVRSMLGANPWRIVRQLLTEATVFGVIGAAGGVAVAFALMQGTRLLISASLQRGAEVSLNWRVLIAAVLVSIGTCLLASLLPAVSLSLRSSGVLARSGYRAGSDRGQHRLRSLFVMCQFAMALVLVVISGLLLSTLVALRGQNFGFDPAHILTAEIALSPGSYESRDVLTTFYNPMLERVSALPGVAAAGLIQMLPVQTSGWSAAVHIVGQPPSPLNEERMAELRMVTPGYHAVFNNRLLRGRLLDARIDNTGTQPVVIVNETFVRRFVPDGLDPVGQQLADGNDKSTIVGVVQDIRQNVYQPPLAEMDYPISQMPLALRTPYISNMYLVVRTAGAPESIIGDLRRIFHELDPALPFRPPQSMTQVVQQALNLERLENWLFGSFAALTALLAVVGLYGLISHEVSVSAREISLRMAMGATRLQIARMIYSRVGFMITGGIVVGLLLVWFSQRLLASVMTTRLSNEFGVAALLAALLASAGLLAAFLPARRAASAAPIDALRRE